MDAQSCARACIANLCQVPGIFVNRSCTESARDLLSPVGAAVEDDDYLQLIFKSRGGYTNGFQTLADEPFLVSRRNYN